MPQAAPVLTAIGGAFGSATVATGLAVVGTTVGVAGTVASVNATKRAAAAQTRAIETQQEIQRVQAVRQRRSAIRANLVRRAQAQAQAQAAGAVGSSAVSGGLTSMSSQLGANLGFGAQLSGLGAQQSAFNIAAAQAGGQADLFGTIGGIGFGTAGLGVRYGGFNDFLQG